MVKSRLNCFLNKGKPIVTLLACPPPFGVFGTRTFNAIEKRWVSPAVPVTCIAFEISGAAEYALLRLVGQRERGHRDRLANRQRLLFAASSLLSASVRLDESVCSTLIRLFEKS